MNDELNIFEKTQFMLTKTDKQFLVVYILIVAFELITGHIESLSSLHYVAKPTIVISLIVYFLYASKAIQNRLKFFVIGALAWSLIGDTLLMFVEKSPHIFTFGLVAFLLAHILYILGFLKHRNPRSRPHVFIMLLLIYASGLFYLLKGGLGEMLVPVIIYMIVILIMAYSAFLRFGKANTLSAKLVFVGAIFFMVSDSILALNKFYLPVPYASVSIMTTYAIAQYCIVVGILKLKV